MEMKRNTWLAATVILGMMALGACGTKNANGNMEEVSGEGQKLEDMMQEDQEPANATEEKDQEPADATAEEKQESADAAAEEADAAGNIYIVMEPSEMEWEAEDGTIVLKTEREIPVVTISENEESAAAINGYIESNYPDSDEELLAMAREAYADLGKENWHAFASGETFLPERTDAEVISFTITNYWDMGGAHPNSGRSGLNFSTATGKKLSLEDVMVDKEAATAAIHAFLLEETKKEEYEGMFFEGYEESIGDILTEDSWYLGEDGFHIIVNEYIISPHAAGIMDFVVPYGEADFLKEEFRK